MYASHKGKTFDEMQEKNRAAKAAEEKANTKRENRRTKQQRKRANRDNAILGCQKYDSTKANK